MRFLRSIVFLGIMLLVFLLGGRLQRGAPRGPAAQAAPAAPAGEAPRFAREAADARHDSTRSRLAYAEQWERPVSPALDAFRAWTVRYGAAAPARRGGLEAEGVALARARRPGLLALIKSDPQRALAMTVPAVVRQSLPAAVVAELEQRVSGTGDIGLRESDPEPGTAPASPGPQRFAFVNGVRYTAHAYGRREAQLGKEGASLHGIAIGREFAVHESPLRVLDPGEIPAGTAAPTCPVSHQPVAALAAGVGVNTAALTVVEMNGRLYQLSEADLLGKLEAALAAAEAGSGARVRALSPEAGAGGAPVTAADASTSNTLGTQRVLVLRVDTSDFPGEPLSAAAMQSTMDGTVKLNIDTYAGGLATITTTVSPAVYRLPRTGASYAIAGEEDLLYADALLAAADDYDAASFARVIVLHPRLSASVVAGSQITYAGEALTIGGSKLLINGGVNIGSITHELGHCYGLLHSNLWQVADGSAISAAGTTTEYGDAFDMMGDASHAFGGSRDTRHHFNAWQKNRLGWLPDSAVTTVTTSGTYRIYRFDTATPATGQPLALRIFRDGVRWYWVSLRQSFTTNAATTNGASVVWGFNSPQQSQLLDLTTPGSSAFDAALAVGATLSDPAYGITIKPLARAGSDPAQYLDVEVTIPATPSNLVTAWGRYGALYFAGNTGAPVDPAPETYVPAGLTNVASVAAGDLHALALKADGTLVAWGDNTNGQTTIPAGLDGNVVAVVAGGNVSGVVKRDGTVQLWGEAATTTLVPPAGLTGVRQLAIGGRHTVGVYHAVALKTDGTIVAWGDNAYGQTTVPATATSGIAAVAASDRLSVVLKTDGTLARWGVRFNGEVPFVSGLTGITAIASSGGAEHALALKSDGTVVGWGANSSGQATVPAGLANVVALATGTTFSLALKVDGTVAAWGSNVNGQLNLPSSLPRGYQIAGGSRTGFLLTGAHLYLTASPVAQVVAAGASATFTVGATGAGALTYQWRKDGVAIAGATASTLTIAAATAGHAGNYDVIVRDGANALTTVPVALALAAGPGEEVARIANLSILSSLASRTDSFRLGFVVGGTGTAGAKPLVIRAAGPSLAAFGVPDTLGDPKIEVLTGSTTVAENDDWGGQATVAAAMAAVGAFPYVSSSSLDAAVTTNITGRDNTVVVGSAFGGAPSGAVIAEIYDATPGAIFTAAIPRLINVSVLKDVGVSLTAGFVIGGPADSTKRVLIRAVGPGLADVGVSSGFVLDPKLTLHGANQAVVDANDNWGNTPELAAAFGAVGAFALPAGSNDAALIATLQAGVNYTAVVTGAGGGTGLVLVEVYELP
jgi:alpha-tubulin suppressor-like RCC1 family protein